MPAFSIGRKVVLLSLVYCFCAITLYAQVNPYPSKAQVAADFKKMLSRPVVDFRADFKSITTDSAIIERGTIYSEANEKIPILIYKPVSAGLRSYPAVIFLHGTGGTKDSPEIKNVLYQLCKRGIMGVAIDARYHGTRVPGGARGSKEYAEAVTKAWQNKDGAKQTHPFFYDTVFDLWRLTDYLVSRRDVQANQLGMGGISMGGIETWMAASVDPRIKVVVLDIAAQSFKWSLENDRWQGRAGTIHAAHLQAARDMGDSVLNKRNVKALWDKLIPGITGEFDCPSMIRLIAPRHLLILSAENDQNCPLPGAKIAYESALKAYDELGAGGNIKMDIAPNLGHQTTPQHLQMTLNWFSKWL